MINRAALGTHRLSLPQIALIVAVGLLVIVVGGLLLRTYLSSTRTATAFEEAGYATTNLANIQREVLLLRIETHALFSDFTEGFEPIESLGRDFKPVELRRDFLTAQLRVAVARFPWYDETVAEFDQIRSSLAEYDRLVGLVRANPTFDRAAAIAQTDEILIRLDRQVKALYDQHEILFFRATSASLKSQGSAQTLLLMVSGIMLALCLVLAASLRQSVRTGFKRAYGALEVEIKERQQAQEGERIWAYETSVMAEVGRTVSASLDISEVYESLAQEIRKLIRFDGFSMSLVDYTGGTMSPTWVSGTDIPSRRVGDAFPLAGALAGEVVRTKSPIMLEAEAASDLEHRFPALLANNGAGFRSLMTVPLLDRDAVIGVLQIRSKERGIYTQRHLELLERIGSQITGAIANSQLYAQREKAEEALRDSEELFRQMAENMRDVFFLVDHKNFGVLYVNCAFEELWGRSRESLYEDATVWLEAIHPEDLELVNEAFEKQLTTGEFDEEFRIIRPDGSVRWIHDSLAPIRDELGQISRMVGIACQWRRHVGPLGRSKTVPPGVFMFSEKVRANWPA